METEAPAGRSRPRTWLLAVLGVALVALAATWMWPNRAAVPQPASSNRARSGAPGGQAGAVDPNELDVRLEALTAERPAPGDAERNPFRFQPKAPPPSAERPGGGVKPPPPPLPPVATGPPQPPPIDLKFMGVIDHPKLGKIAAFSDCKGFTAEGQEGRVVDGRYRVVKIGVESVVIEYVNGTGRRTIPLSGCPPK